MENTVNLNTMSSEEIQASPKPRLGAIDIAKGILIFAVVLSHAWFADADILSDFFPYSMPAFFFLSGYTYTPGRKYLKNIGKRAVMLLLPYLFFGIACNLCYPLYVTLTKSPYVMESSVIWTAMLKADAYNMLMSTPMWFLAALFTASVIFFAVADYLRESLPKTLAAVAVLLAMAIAIDIFKKTQLPWYIDLAPYSVAMMLLGSYFGGKKLFTSLNLKTVIIGICCLAVSYLFNRLFPGSAKTSVVQYITDGQWYGVLTAFVIALSGSIGLLCICNVLDRIPVLRSIIKWMGRNSIWILCIHYCVIMLVELQLYNMGYLSNSLIQVVTRELFGYGFVRDTTKDVIIKVAVAVFSVLVSGVYAVIHKSVKKRIKAYYADKKSA